MKGGGGPSAVIALPGERFSKQVFLEELLEAVRLSSDIRTSGRK